jgi:hypothetical protein
MTTPTNDDLATFLNADVDTARAFMMIDLAVQACSAIVDPVPDTANFVILSVAARAYTSPVPVSAQQAGPFSMSGTQGGISLTRAEERQLRRLAGGGGAFSFSPLAADAGTDLPWWDSNGDPTATI